MVANYQVAGITFIVYYNSAEGGLRLSKVEQLLFFQVASIFKHQSSASIYTGATIKNRPHKSLCIALRKSRNFNDRLLYEHPFCN